MTFLSRRHALLGALLAGTGCAPGFRAEIPGVRSAERLLGDGPVVLGPDEGLVAGVAIVAFSLAVASGLNLSLGRILQTRFILADAADQQVSIPIRPPLEDTEETLEAGVTFWITPFAMKLPAGRHRLIGHARRVAQPTPTGWMFFEHAAPLAIDVRAGEAANIGGIGHLAQNLVFADRAARDAACPPAWRDDRTVYGPLCSRFEASFLRHDMARDRARILARFPALAGLSLVDRPLAPTAQWPLWPDVLLRWA